ncbi:MAG: SDR family oxidoreductase [Desulfobacterales bacterium]|nr:SDR family oxidoreductase [Desulfobacterales bacterium]
MQKQIRTALVTGASSGIGRETAILLAAEGFQVIAAARRLDRLVELADQNQGIIPKQVDLSDSEDVEAFCGYISELPQPVSVLVNNAGYSTRGVLEDVALNKIKRMFEVNVFSLIRVTQACLPGMRKARAGMIVNLSSIVGKFPFPGSGLYASSKYAVEAITDALRIELAPLGIKVVAIRPGAIATEFGEVAEKMTGDLLSRTDPDYKPIYQAVKTRMDKIFKNQSASRPQLIAHLIMEAVLSYPPRAAYAAGILSDEFLGKRADLNDDEFCRFMLEKFNLSNLMNP